MDRMPVIYGGDDVSFRAYSFCFYGVVQMKTIMLISVYTGLMVWFAVVLLSSAAGSLGIVLPF